MPQRRALAVLFAFLAALFAGIAVAAVSARVWVIALAGAVLSVWIAGMAVRALRKTP